MTAWGRGSPTRFRSGSGRCSPCFTARPRANGVYSVGQYAGLAFFSPLLFWVVAAFGWRSLFLICGSIGVTYAFIWYASYREPHESKLVGQAELDYIEEGGGLGHRGAQVPFSWNLARRILAKRQILGASIGQFGANSTQVFFVTWFPTYLVTARGMTFIKAGLMRGVELLEQPRSTSQKISAMLKRRGKIEARGASMT